MGISPKTEYSIEGRPFYATREAMAKRCGMCSREEQARHRAFGSKAASPPITGSHFRGWLGWSLDPKMREMDELPNRSSSPRAVSEQRAIRV
jgi:hypothetical protein